MRVKKADTSITEADSSPFIDMVFQLIAFFMVLVNFSDAEQDTRVRLPTSELAKPPDTMQENIITVNVGKDGTVYMAGQAYDLAGLADALGREREQLVRQGESPAGATIAIRAHREVKTGQVQKVIQECQKQSFEKFALRAEEQQ